MKTLFYIACLIVLVSSPAIGQHQKEIDSLMAAVEKDPGSRALYSLGMIYFKEGKIEEAHELFEKLITNYIENEIKLGQIYSRIGSIYFYNGWSFEAEDFFLKSLEKATSSHDTATLSSTSSELSILYNNSNQFQKSIELIENTIPFDKTNLVALYTNDAINYLELYKPYEAIGMLYKAMHYLNSDPKGNPVIASIVHHNLGQCFIMLNQPDSAALHIGKTLAINTGLNDTTGLIYDYALQGKYFRSVFKKREAANAYNKALNLHKAYGYLEDGWDKDEYLQCLDSLAKTYKEIGLIDSAFYMTNVSAAALKKIRDDENKKRMDKNYASLESNIRKQLEQKNKMRKYQIQYYSIAVCLVLVSLIYLAFSRFDKQRKYSKYISIFILLLIFEFVLVLLDPYITKRTSDVPLFNFLANILVAVLIIPVHRGGEKLLNKVVLDIKFRKIEE